MFGHFAIDGFHSDGRRIHLLYHSFFQSMTFVNCLENSTFLAETCTTAEHTEWTPTTTLWQPQDWCQHPPWLDQQWKRPSPSPRSTFRWPSMRSSSNSNCTLWNFFHFFWYRFKIYMNQSNMRLLQYKYRVIMLQRTNQHSGPVRHTIQILYLDPECIGESNGKS